MNLCRVIREIWYLCSFSGYNFFLTFLQIMPLSNIISFAPQNILMLIG